MANSAELHLRVRACGNQIDVVLDSSMNLRAAETKIFSQIPPGPPGQQPHILVGFPPKSIDGISRDCPCTNVFRDHDTLTVGFGPGQQDIRREGDGKVRQSPPPTSNSPPPSLGSGPRIAGVNNTRSGGAITNDGGVGRVQNDTGGG